MATAEMLLSKLIPVPRTVCVLDGTSELSEDVRLVTRDVLPLQRKAMRGILTGAGIRVVANKKKFIIEARVAPLAELDMTDVPQAAQQEFYELEICDNRVFIRTASQAGALWGTHTLAALYEAAGHGAHIPNMLIRDWPSLPVRGVSVQAWAGTEQMTVQDWFAFLDRLAALRMNLLSLDLYTSRCNADGACIDESLMVPVAEEPDMRPTRIQRYYSPKAGEWNEEPVLPEMVELDFFADVVAAGKEKGILIVPGLTGFGANTFVGAAVPEAAAKAEDGQPLDRGCCLAAPATRDFLSAFCQSLLERYFPDGIPVFRLHLIPDTDCAGAAAARAATHCRCTACQAENGGAILQDFVLWFIRMLAENGVDRVLMWQEEAAADGGPLGAAFLSRLQEAGLTQRLVLECAAGGETAATPGVERWIAPALVTRCSAAVDSLPEPMEDLLRSAAFGAAGGMLAAAANDPGGDDRLGVLAGHVWAMQEEESLCERQETWARVRFGDRGAAFLQALSQVRQAVAAGPAGWLCCDEDASAQSNALPENDLIACEPSADSDPAKGAAAAVTALRALAGTEMSGARAACVQSLLGDAIRVTATADCLRYLQALRRAAAAGTVDDALVTARAGAHAALLEAMAEVEQYKPDWCAAGTLQPLSGLLVLLERLDTELAEVQAGSRAPADLSLHTGGPDAASS